MRRILDRLFDAMSGSKRFYGFFYYLFLRSLKGMEQGYNFGEVHTSGELNVIKLLETRRYVTILDGGGNKGQYALGCTMVLGERARIYSFEPSKYTFETFVNNTRDFSNIRPVNVALSDKEQTLILHYDEVNSGLASVVECNFDHYDLQLDKSEPVTGITLDKFIHDNAISKVDLLKLDLEGYEYYALLGANESIQSDKIEMIQFEMGRPNVDSKSMFKDFFYLLKDKYNFYRILSYGFTAIPSYSYEYELFFGCNFVAVHKSSGIKIETI